MFFPKCKILAWCMFLYLVISYGRYILGVSDGVLFSLICVGLIVAVWIFMMFPGGSFYMDIYSGGFLVGVGGWGWVAY